MLFGVHNLCFGLLLQHLFSCQDGKLRNLCLTLFACLYAHSFGFFFSAAKFLSSFFFCLNHHFGSSCFCMLFCALRHSFSLIVCRSYNFLSLNVSSVLSIFRCFSILDTLTYLFFTFTKNFQY